MSANMTRWGIGPLWTGVTAICAIPVLLAQHLHRDLFTFYFVPRLCVIVCALVLLAVGVPFLASALITLHRRFDGHHLVTSGPYRLCRHPIYAAWTLFLVPAIMLLVDAWIGLAVPIIMWATLRLMVPREERWLATTYGAEYQAYRARVPAVFPLARRWWHDDASRG
jgi:protein-S-isoprenylcysteine O-methyltransferase Ste14